VDFVTTTRRTNQADRGAATALRARRTESPSELVGRVLHPSYSAGPLEARGLHGVVSSIGEALSSGDLDLESWLRLRGTEAARTRRPDEGRAYAQLLGTPHLELWLIEWGPSAFLDLHDHGGAIGAIRLLQGNLVETYTDLTSRSPLQSRVYSAGDQCELPSDHVHEMWNVTGQPALSLHGYSPRLSQMTFYDHSEPSFLTALRTAVFDPETTPELVLSGDNRSSQG
jgi:hypothetical protein